MEERKYLLRKGPSDRERVEEGERREKIEMDLREDKSGAIKLITMMLL